jgi:hypothetical protein
MTVSFVLGVFFLDTLGVPGVNVMILKIFRRNKWKKKWPLDSIYKHTYIQLYIQLYIPTYSYVFRAYYCFLRKTANFSTKIAEKSDN